MKHCITTEFSEIEIRELISSTLQEVLKQTLPQLFLHLGNAQPDAKGTQFLNRKAVCELLQISLPTLSKLQKEGKIKAVIVGGSYRYNRRDIDLFMNGALKK